MCYIQDYLDNSKHLCKGSFQGVWVKVYCSILSKGSL